MTIQELEAPNETMRSTLGRLAIDNSERSGQLDQSTGLIPIVQYYLK